MALLCCFLSPVILNALLIFSDASDSCLLAPPLSITSRELSFFALLFLIFAGSPVVFSLLPLPLPVALPPLPVAILLLSFLLLPLPSHLVAILPGSLFGSAACAGRQTVDVAVSVAVGAFGCRHS